MIGSHEGGEHLSTEDRGRGERFYPRRRWRGAYRCWEGVRGVGGGLTISLGLTNYCECSGPEAFSSLPWSSLSLSLSVSPSTNDHPNTNDGRRASFPLVGIQNYIAEADADLIPVPGQLELHMLSEICGVLLSPCFGALSMGSQI